MFQQFPISIAEQNIYYLDYLHSIGAGSAVQCEAQLMFGMASCQSVVDRMSYFIFGFMPTNNSVLRNYLYYILKN